MLGGSGVVSASGPAAGLEYSDLPVRTPAPSVIPDARARIREFNRSTGRRIAVLDDDPTGSQTVHDVEIVFVLEPSEFASGLAQAGSTCFVLTNSRSLTEAEAVARNLDAARSLLELGVRLGAPIELISRGDSTLRGHVIAEVRALDSAAREVTGRTFDAVLFAPAFIEAGRVTIDDTHWARVSGRWLPVGQTEFARDASFGYQASDLRAFLEETSQGAIQARSVRSIQLTDIRLGGPRRVAEILGGVTDCGFVVINATSYEDLEIVLLGVQAAERDGQMFLFRTGPSFVRALAGLEPRAPLSSGEIWPTGRADGHGLVVAGSHVKLTSRQLDVARERTGLAQVEIEVGLVADAARREAHVADVAQRVLASLATTDTALVTSRQPLLGVDPADSLRISSAVSRALVDVVRRVRFARPAWVIAKGGITSHDVATEGLGIRRARVRGQLGPGVISVFEPVGSAIPGPYVVFPGNVGDESTLADVVATLRGVG